MHLASIRLITDDPTRLATFYQAVTGVTPTWYTPDFAEVITPTGTLAIASKRTTDLFNAGAALAAHNRSVIIEYRVDDVDQTYNRLKDVITDLVQAPITQPWGNRSLLFRDPDGNLVNFFTPITADAIAKFTP